MKKDTLYGPPKELFTDKEAPRRYKKKGKKGKGEEEDDEMQPMDPDF